MSTSKSDKVPRKNKQESAEAAPVWYQRDMKYYIHTISFLIENTMFKVPRSGFEGRKGSQFEVCYIPGNDNQNPMKLDVKAHQFKSILKVIFGNLDELGADEQDLSPPPTLTDDEWIDVLELSTTWRFNDVRAKAIEHLELRVAPPGAAKTIRLSRQFGSRSLFFAGVERATLWRDHIPLSVFHDKFSDLETIAKIYSLRDRYSPRMRALYHDADSKVKVDGDWVAEQASTLVKSKLCDKCRPKVKNKAESFVRSMMEVPQGAPVVCNTKELLESLRADIAVLFEEDLEKMS